MMRFEPRTSEISSSCYYCEVWYGASSEGAC